MRFRETRIPFETCIRLGKCVTDLVEASRKGTSRFSNANDRLCVAFDHAKATAKRAATICLDVSKDLVPTTSWRDGWLDDVEAAREHLLVEASRMHGSGDGDAVETLALLDTLAGIFRRIRVADEENAPPRNAHQSARVRERGAALPLEPLASDEGELRSP